MNTYFKIEQFEQSWKVRDLPNGLRLLHLPKPHDWRFFLGATFGVGSNLEAPGKAGLSHFLEHMMFRGSKKFPSFSSLAHAFEMLGGEWNAATSVEQTEYTYSGILDPSREVFSLFSEFLSNPLFLDIEREREIILREIEDDLNEYGNSVDLNLHMSKLFWPHSQRSSPILGTQESVQNLSYTDLSLYREKFYHRENLVLCAAGGDDSDEIIDLLSESFENYPLRQSFKKRPQTTLVPVFEGPRCRLIEHSDNQYHIQMSFLSEGEDSPKAPIHSIISFILADGLSSRLFIRLREELGLVYDVSAQSQIFSTWGSFDIQASVTPQKLHSLISELYKVLSDLSDQGPSDIELSKAIRRAKTDLLLVSCDPEELGLHLAWRKLSGKDLSISSLMGMLDLITPETVKSAAQELFRKERCGLVLLGPKQHGLEESVRTLLSRGGY